mgnify:CR=1 FL=1
MQPVIVEHELMGVVRKYFPSYEVRFAPDKVEGGAVRLIAIRGTHTPIDGVRGRKSIVDIEVFDASAEGALSTADSVVACLEQAHMRGELPFISTLRMVTLPSLVESPTSALSMSVAAFSFMVVGHYLHP